MGTVLLVEDYTPLATVMALALRRLGHNVVRTYSARARAAAGSFDVAIVDLDIAEGLGVEVARELWSAGRAGRVIFYTACRDDELLKSAARFGIVVSKDAGLDALFRVVHEFWGAPASTMHVVNGPDVVDSSQVSGARPRAR